MRNIYGFSFVFCEWVSLKTMKTIYGGNENTNLVSINGFSCQSTSKWSKTKINETKYIQSCQWNS